MVVTKKHLREVWICPNRRANILSKKSINILNPTPSGSTLLHSFLHARGWGDFVKGDFGFGDFVALVLHFCFFEGSVVTLEDNEIS